MTNTVRANFTLWPDQPPAWSITVAETVETAAGPKTIVLEEGVPAARAESEYGVTLADVVDGINAATLALADARAATIADLQAQLAAVTAERDAALTQLQSDPA